MSNLDPMNWHVFGRMMCIHPRTCPNPTYVRAVVAWWPSWGNNLDKSWLKRKMLWLWPALIGATAIVCVHCSEISISSRFGAYLFDFIHRLFDPEGEWLDSIIMLDEDVMENMSFKQKQDMSVEPIND
jgi:hypothetical protein